MGCQYRRQYSWRIFKVQPSDWPQQEAPKVGGIEHNNTKSRLSQIILCPTTSSTTRPTPRSSRPCRHLPSTKATSSICRHPTSRCPRTRTTPSRLVVLPAFRHRKFWARHNIIIKITQCTRMPPVPLTATHHLTNTLRPRTPTPSTHPSP
jgi:hypothetical protein